MRKTPMKISDIAKRYSVAEIKHKMASNDNRQIRLELLPRSCSRDRNLRSLRYRYRKLEKALILRLWE